MKSFGTAQGDRGLIGTEAERLALILQESQAPLLFLVTAGGRITEWWWYGSTAGWVPGQTYVSGAALVSDAALDYMPYSDATYTYYCEAAPGTALATASWRIARKHNATGRIEYADGGAFSNAATNLATVQGAFA